MTIKKIINFALLEKFKKNKELSFKNGKLSFLDSLTGFIKYHNAFAVGISLVLVSSGVIFAASPEIRENTKEALILSEEVVRSIDNSWILVADLDNFDFNLQITEITEDDMNYYISYSYKTLAIQDYAWQEVKEEKTFDVPKDTLAGKDLGLYITKQLGQMIDNQLSYFKEVREIEQKKGLTQKIVAVQYAGLLGKFLNSKEKIFPDYEVVIKPSEPEIVSRIEIIYESTCQPITEICDGLDNDCDGEVDENNICGVPSALPSVASAEAEEGAEPELPADVCDADHLDLCDTQEKCETAGFCWHNDICNTEEQEIPVCVPEWSCSGWLPLPETIACGDVFSQTQTCNDLNSCGIDDGKPAEEQEITGTDAGACGTTFCDATMNLAGERANACVEQACVNCIPTCVCADGFSDCDSDSTNGCETQGACE